MSIPILHRQVASTICGVHTEFVFTRFSNLIVVSVSQTGRHGQWVRCGVVGSLYDAEVTIGDPEDAFSLAIARIISQIAGFLKDFVVLFCQFSLQVVRYSCRYQ